MKFSDILIHLHNNVDAFSLKPRHVELLRQSLPDARLTVAASTSDFLDRLFERGDHNTIMDVNGNAYFRAVERFIGRLIAPATECSRR